MGGTGRRLRRPGSEGPAGPAPSLRLTAPARPPARRGPGSPASRSNRTGLLGTHFTIPFQVDPSPPGARPPPPRPRHPLALAPKAPAGFPEPSPRTSVSKWTWSDLSPLSASSSPPHPPIFSCSPSFCFSLAFPPRLLISCNSFHLYERWPHDYPPPSPKLPPHPFPANSPRDNPIHTRPELTCFQPAAKSRLT